MMSTLMGNQRDDLALKMLAAWVNCPPEKMPEQYKSWTDDYSRQAWQRVAQAAENHFRAQLAAAEEERDCAEDALKAWFDTQKLMSAQLDPKIVDAASGYLRTSRVGGMSNEESDLVLGVIQDMARLNVFSSIYTQAHKTAEADKLAAMERVVKKVITIIDLLSLGRSHSAHKAMVQAIHALALDALAEGDE